MAKLGATWTAICRLAPWLSISMGGRVVCERCGFGQAFEQEGDKVYLTSNHSWRCKFNHEPIEVTETTGTYSSLRKAKNLGE